MLYEVIRLPICEKIRIYSDPYEIAILIAKICMRLGNKICSLRLIRTDLKWPQTFSYKSSYSVNQFLGNLIDDLYTK